MTIQSFIFVSSNLNFCIMARVLNVSEIEDLKDFCFKFDDYEVTHNQDHVIIVGLSGFSSVFLCSFMESFDYDFAIIDNVLTIV